MNQNNLRQVDALLKRFNQQVHFRDREERYRRAVPNYEQWRADCGRNVDLDCWGAAVRFSTALGLRYPRLVRRIRLYVLSYHNRYDTYYKREVRDRHVVCELDGLCVDPTTGLIYLSTVADLVSNPENANNKFEGTMGVAQWVSEKSLQWRASPHFITYQSVEFWTHIHKLELRWGRSAALMFLNRLSRVAAMLALPRRHRGPR